MAFNNVCKIENDWSMQYDACGGKLLDKFFETPGDSVKLFDMNFLSHWCILILICWTSNYLTLSPGALGIV